MSELETALRYMAEEMKDKHKHYAGRLTHLAVLDMLLVVANRLQEERENDREMEV